MDSPPSRPIPTRAPYLTNGKPNLTAEFARIEKNVDGPNKGYLIKYSDYLSRIDRKERTLAKRLGELRCICAIGICQDFKAITKEEVEAIVTAVNRLEAKNSAGVNLHRDITPYSKARIKLCFKQFIKWLTGSDALVSWIKLSKSAIAMKLPEELLTEEDVEKLLKACRNPRDLALCALAWDSGARIGEILNCKVGSLVFSIKSANYVMLDGKTGRRRTPLSVSVPYLSRYLNEYRRNVSKDAPLFVTIGRGQPTQRAMDYNNVRNLFQDLRVRAKLDKTRLHPHLFRYSRCTHLAALGMPAEALKLYFGWVSVKMVDHYSKLSGAQVDAAFYKAIGQNPEEYQITPTLAAKRCDNCKFSNDALALFCVKCGNRLDKNGYEQLEESDALRKELSDLRADFAFLANAAGVKKPEDVANVLNP